MADPIHPAMPFRFAEKPDGSTDIVTNAQNSAAEVRAAIEAVLRCPLGFRDERPAFGLTDPTFSQAPLSTDEIRRVVTVWEPRAVLFLHEYGDLTDEAIRHITIEIQEQV
jgi:hypothetical protein